MIFRYECILSAKVLAPNQVSGFTGLLSIFLPGSTSAQLLLRLPSRWSLATLFTHPLLTLAQFWTQVGGEPSFGNLAKQKRAQFWGQVPDHILSN